MANNSQKTNVYNTNYGYGNRSSLSGVQYDSSQSVWNQGGTSTNPIQQQLSQTSTTTQMQPNTLQQQYTQNQFPQFSQNFGVQQQELEQYYSSLPASYGLNPVTPTGQTQNYAQQQSNQAQIGTFNTGNLSANKTSPTVTAASQSQADYTSGSANSFGIGSFSAGNVTGTSSIYSSSNTGNTFGTSINTNGIDKSKNNTSNITLPNNANGFAGMNNASGSGALNNTFGTPNISNAFAAPSMSNAFGAASGGLGNTSQTNAMNPSSATDAMNQINQFLLLQNSLGTGSTTTPQTLAPNLPNMNAGLMSLFQQSLPYWNSGAWVYPDNSGGFYAPPMNMGTMGTTTNSFQFGGAGVNQDMQSNFSKGFAKNFTGSPAVMGQGGKGKRLMNGVRINVKSEKVVDVEVPISLYSRWGQLRKFFSKQDTEVAKHLIEFHDENCEQCMAREGTCLKFKSKRQKLDEKSEEKETEEEEEEEINEEDLAIREIMGFGNFNTTWGAKISKQMKRAEEAAVNSQSQREDSESKAGFIGARKLSSKSGDSNSSTQQADNPLTMETKDDSAHEEEGEAVLTEEEKAVMMKLGWTVFNRKPGDKTDGEANVKNGDEAQDNSAKPN